MKKNKKEKIWDTISNLILYGGMFMFIIMTGVLLIPSLSNNECAGRVYAISILITSIFIVSKGLLNIKSIWENKQWELY